MSKRLLPEDSAASDEVILVDKISKKFCRKLKTSLAYGLQDIARELLGVERNARELRPGEFWALEDVSFILKRGESVGVVGANGAGKTTMLKVLSGLLKPDVGAVRIRGRLAPLIALGAGFKPVLTGRENIYVNLSILGMTVKETESRFEEIVEFSDLRDAIDSPLKTYSSGMAARLGFSCAIHTEPDILLIDEVLAVGDISFRAKCYRRLAELRRRGTAFLLVSHSPTAILGSCDKCIYMDHGKIVDFGDASSVVRRYEEDLRKLPPPKAGHAGIKAAAAASVALPGFKMERIYFTDGNGQQIESPESGSKASLHIRCLTSIEFPKVHTTIIIREAFGDLQTTLTLSTKDPVALPIGGSEIVLEFPYLGLRSGLYTMKLGLTTGTLEHVAAVESFRFYVGRNDNIQHSLFYQPCEWRLVRLVKPAHNATGDSEQVQHQAN